MRADSIVGSIFSVDGPLPGNVAVKSCQNAFGCAGTMYREVDDEQNDKTSRSDVSHTAININRVEIRL